MRRGHQRVVSGRHTRSAGPLQVSRSSGEVVLGFGAASRKMVHPLKPAQTAPAVDCGHMTTALVSGRSFSYCPRHQPRMSDMTQILNAIEAGDDKAWDQLLPLVYEELRNFPGYMRS